jgi:predicted ATPase
MISNLKIKNFKCFTDVSIPFGSLTLLTGFNSAGKSSAIQPLIVLAQGLRSSHHTGKFQLNGPMVRLGTASDILPLDATDSLLSFSVAGDIGEKTYFLQANAGDRLLHSIPDIPNSSSTGKAISDDVVASLAKLTYLSAVRMGTPDEYPIPDKDIDTLRDVGTDGRFAPYWYDRFVDEPVLEARRNPNEKASSLRKQLDSWLGSLFPGAQANVQMFPQLSLLGLQFRLSDIGTWRRPANVGYGFTYVFPILVALLTVEVNQVIVIDSPEAHLHPSAQSQMGRLLAHFAAAGVQVIVETHSDHLLNGARLAVKEGLIKSAALRILFFTGATKDSHGVRSPLLDSNGRVDEWPTGFFDQSERDLSLLAGWL